jgi:transcription antitermination factor NusG
MSESWYALHVKPHKERPVCNLLKARGLTVYYPSLKVKPVNPRSRRERPFFPGYMFVCVDLELEGVNSLRWSEGTHGLVEFGGDPAIVPDSLISELQRQLEEHQKSYERQKDFKSGDPIRIIDGLFEGYEAIFDSELTGKDRVQVLLSYLGDRPKRVQLHLSDIEKMDTRH